MDKGTLIPPKRVNQENLAIWVGLLETKSSIRACDAVRQDDFLVMVQLNALEICIKLPNFLADFSPRGPTREQ